MPHDDVQYILNIQPVIPFRLTDEWNLISRHYRPLIYQPRLAPGVGEISMGDIQQSVLPVTGEARGAHLGRRGRSLVPHGDRRRAGPRQVGSRSDRRGIDHSGPWVIGTLINSVWSFAGDGDRQGWSTQMSLQPFVNYNFPGRLVRKLRSEDHGRLVEAHGSDRWTVPIGGGVGKILRIGALPLEVHRAPTATHRLGRALAWTGSRELRQQDVRFP